MQTHICTQYENFETELCKHLRACEAIFSSLFQPQFRAHKPGRKIAEAASGHCRNSHTWPFGQEEVQLREFVSTLHVKPLNVLSTNGCQLGSQGVRLLTKLRLVTQVVRQLKGSAR